jgi:uncharacterized protein (DUF2345 family)
MLTLAEAVPKKRPIVSFDSYFESWSQLASTKPTTATGTLKSTHHGTLKSGHEATKGATGKSHGASKYSSAVVAARIPSGVASFGRESVAEDSDEDEEAEELCNWSKNLRDD